MRKVYPLPEAVRGDGKEWDIEPSGGTVPRVELSRAGQGAHRMYVPLLADDWDRRVRAHEMAHAKWSPQRRKVDPVLEKSGLMNAAEDARINYKSRRAGLDLSVPLMQNPDIDRMAAMFSSMPPTALAGMVLASLGTGDEGTAREIASRVPGGDRVVSLAERADREIIRQRRGKDRAPFSNAVRAAEWLFEQLGDRPPMDEQGDDPEQDRADQDADNLDNNYYGDEGDGPPRWSDMEIIERPRPLRLPSRFKSKRRRCRDIGTNLVRIDRLPVDGKVFRENRRRKENGGAVLLDLSGSMSLTPEQVEQLLLAYPAGIIAGYKSGGQPPNRGGDGALFILARNGRRVSAEHTPAADGGNDVDLPALEWLGQQEGPRIWVTDGEVVPGGGGSYDLARKQCAAAVRRFKVKVVSDIADVVG